MCVTFYLVVLVITHILEPYSQFPQVTHWGQSRPSFYSKWAPQLIDTSWLHILRCFHDRMVLFLFFTAIEHWGTWLLSYPSKQRTHRQIHFHMSGYIDEGDKEVTGSNDQATKYTFLSYCKANFSVQIISIFWSGWQCATISGGTTWHRPYVSNTS